MNSKKMKALACLLLSAAVAMSGILCSVQEADAATKTYPLYIGSCYYYANAHTWYKYVIIDGNVRDAYCIQPKKAKPPEGNHSASTISADSEMARCLYYAREAPGEAQFKEYLESNGMGERCATDEKYYCFMHAILSRAYLGKKKAYDLGKGRTLNKEYRNDVETAYGWLVKQRLLTDIEFSVKSGSATSVTARYDAASDTYTTKDDPFTMNGNAEQYFSYAVPKYATLFLKKPGKTKYTSYASGESLKIYGGSSFYYEFRGDASGFTKTVTGGWQTITPWKMEYGSKKQDIAFFSETESASADFSVVINKTPLGRFSLEKMIRKSDGTTEPECGVRFRAYKNTFSSYEAAKAASSRATPYAVEITTGSSGGAVSGYLALGTYIIRQVNSTEGYSLAADTTVTITEGTIQKVAGSPLIDQAQPLKIVIRKTEEGTGNLITSSSARFGIYRDKDCSALVQQISTSAGTATSRNLPEGVYYIKEITPPAGYDCSDQVMKVILTYDTAVESEGLFTYTVNRFDNTKTVTHNLKILKKIKGSGLSERSFRFKVELQGLAANTTYNYTLAGDATNFDSDASGKAVLYPTITAAQTLTVQQLPSTAKYRITEMNDDGAVLYKASYAVTSGAGSVTAPQGSADAGKSLSTKWERFPAKEAAGETNDSYTVVYAFTNDAQYSSDLIINKKIAGTGASHNDVFSFSVELSNLKNCGTSYEVPGYSIYETDDDGNQKNIASAVSTTSSSPAKTISIRLKDGQSVKFIGLSPASKYKITESAFEGYTSSWKTDARGATVQRGEYATPRETIPDNQNLTLTYHFLNTARSQFVFNRLIVTKTVSPETDEPQSFSVDIEIEGLDEERNYPLLLKKRTAEAGNITINKRTDSSAPFQTSAPGIVYSVTRNDGAVRWYQTDAEGKADKMASDAFAGWVGIADTPSEVTVNILDEEFAVTYTMTQSGFVMNMPVDSITTRYQYAGDSIISAGEGVFRTHMSPEDVLVIDGLPEGASYKVTELGNDYSPSYEIIRYYPAGGTTKRLDVGEGTPGQNMETEVRTFGEVRAYDVVALTNVQETADLEVTKTVDKGEKNKKFTFDVSMSGLKENKRYTVLADGTDNYDIDITRTGIIAVTGVSETGSAVSGADIEVKLTRPDGKTKTVTTNGSGTIPTSSYRTWLLEGAEGTETSITFTAEYLNATAAFKLDYIDW